MNTFFDKLEIQMLEIHAEEILANASMYFNARMISRKQFNDYRIESDILYLQALQLRQKNESC
jgi:hypothetical protein